MGLEDDRREDLDPVGDQLAVTRHARLARLRVGTQPPRPLARHKRRLAVGRPGADRDQRLGDPPGHELVAASCVRSLVEVDRALAGLAGVVPRLLARKPLGEPMRPVPVCGHAAVELATVPRLAVVAVKAHARAGVLWPGTRGPRPAPPLPARRHSNRRR